jgi:hypothetical protein
MNMKFLIEMLMMMLRGYIFKTEKLAPVSKYLLRIRDYLILFLPLEEFPPFETDDPVFRSIHPEDVKAIPVEAIVDSGKKEGFNIPFIKGM